MQRLKLFPGFDPIEDSALATVSTDVDRLSRPGSASVDSADFLSEVDPSSAAQMWQALHEMRVAIIELEVQNDELRRHQAALERDRAHYASLFAGTPAACLVLSKVDVLVEANRLAASMLGSTPSELVGRAVGAIILAEDLDAYHLAHRRLLSTGAAQTCQLRLLRSDGATVGVRLAMGLHHDVAGCELLQWVMQHSDLLNASAPAPVADGDGVDSGISQMEATSQRSCFRCALHSDCLPRGLSRDELQIFDRMVESPRALAPKQMLIRSSDAIRRMYLVRSGAFKSSITQEDGSTQIIAVHLPGELICPDAMEQRQFRCDVEALQRSQVCALPRERIQELCERMPSLQQQLLRLMVHEMTYDQDHLIAMGQHTALKRVVQFLRNLAARCTHKHLDPAHLQLPMTRSDIGNYLGLAEETVCRTLKGLEREGLIQIRGKKLKILDLSALTTLAQSND
jgi:CRP/FNR family transcriptional regulator, anaerobic regulatory protein